MAFAAGTRLGVYEITGLIGVGGMGEVYRARDTTLGREVAIKTLPSELAREPDRLARFEREAKLLAALNHPHIAVVFGLGEHEGTKFLAMELVEGETLDRKLQGPMPVEDVLRLALQIAEALEAAHEKGVVHRDLKPANIMVSGDGQVKVLDFGLAKTFSADPKQTIAAHSPALSLAMTQQGLVLGTAGYMSPEQASGQATDQRADIWAFGVVLFEMLTGAPLFSGESVPHILAEVLRTEPDWTRLPKNMHPRLRLLLERCLTKKPRSRLHSIADARVEIEAVLGDPRGVTPDTEVAARAAQSSNMLRLAGAVAATAVVTAVAGWLLHPASVPEPKPVVRLSVTLPPEQSFTDAASMIALSPDGTRIAYVASGQIFLRNLGESESRPVQGTAETGGGPVAPAFSPDGQWLAYVHAVSLQGPFSLKRVPISGGAPVAMHSYDAGPTNFLFGLTWPLDDTILFATHEGIVSIPANGGATEILVPQGEDERFDSPQLLPGGKAVLFARFSRAPGDLGRLEAAQVVVQSIGGSDRTVVWEGGSAPRYLPTGHLVYAQGNTLFAIPFDASRRTVSGGPVPIIQGVRRSSNRFSDAAQYAVSDTGTLVTIPGVAAARPEVVLALVDRAGKVSPLDVPRAQYRSPRVSPDGKRVAVEVVDEAGRGQIWIYDLAGGSAIRRLTQSGNNTRPIWTPNSSSVTFGSERDSTWGIYEQPADGSRLAERLTTANKERRHLPDSWSPDGQTLAYTDAGLSTQSWDLWTFSRPSEKAELFAGGDYNQMLAAFSPDGRWLAYTNGAPPIGLQVQPFPATGVVHQITESGEAAPVWTAAGDELFFRTALNAGQQRSQIKGLEIATAGGITLRNERTLPIQGAIMNLGYRDFDVTPDGEHFVMIYPADVAARQDAPTAQIDVVLNWFEELKRRVPVQ